MDRSSLIVVVIPIVIPIAVVTGISLAFRRGQPFRAQPCQAAAGIRRCAGADRCRRAEGPAAETRRS